METVVLNSPDKEIYERIKKMKAINLASAERTKVRRRELQKTRKAVKLRQIVGAAMTKERLENMC